MNLDELEVAVDWWDSMLLDPEGHEPMPVPEGKAKHIHAFVEAARGVVKGEDIYRCSQHGFRATPRCNDNPRCDLFLGVWVMIKEES